MYGILRWLLKLKHLVIISKKKERLHLHKSGIVVEFNKKIITSKGVKSPPSSSYNQGTLAIIDQFPFAQFSNFDVIYLFEKNGFSLESKEDI
jgi:hypothetical protein